MYEGESQTPILPSIFERARSRRAQLCIFRKDRGARMQWHDPYQARIARRLVTSDMGTMPRAGAGACHFFVDDIWNDEIAILQEAQTTERLGLDQMDENAAVKNDQHWHALAMNRMA